MSGPHGRMRKSGPKPGKTKKGAHTALPTDSDIAAGGAGVRSSPEKELVRWQDDGDAARPGTSLTLEGGGKKWDQFEANQRLFGVTTTFDMDLYTTKLDTSSGWFHKNKDRAEQMAREIEGRSASNVHQAEERGQKQLRDNDDGNDAEDEEERYSGVQRTAPTTALSADTGGKTKYVPPHLRSGSPANKAATAAAAPDEPAASSKALSAPASPATLPPPASPATPPPPPSSTAEGASSSTERKKLSLNPGATVFQPALKISFSPPPIPKPASAPPPVAMVPMPGQGVQQPPPQPFMMMGPPPPGAMPMGFQPQPGFQMGMAVPVPYGTPPHMMMVHPHLMQQQQQQRVAAAAAAAAASQMPPHDPAAQRPTSPATLPMGQPQSPLTLHPHSPTPVALPTPVPQAVLPGAEVAGGQAGSSFRDKLRLAASKVINEPAGGSAGPTQRPSPAPVVIATPPYQPAPSPALVAGSK